MDRSRVIPNEKLLFVKKTYFREHTFELLTIAFDQHSSSGTCKKMKIFSDNICSVDNNLFFIKEHWKKTCQRLENVKVVHQYLPSILGKDTVAKEGISGRKLSL